MTASRLIAGIKRVWMHGKHGIRWLDKQSHGWIGIIGTAAKQATDPNSVITAAAISYFGIFSLFPLIVLSIGIASLGFGSLVDPHTIVERLEFITPALGQLFGENIDEVIRLRGPATVVALLSLIWSASTFFFILTGSLNQIWGIKRIRPMWKRRGMAIIFVLVFAGPILFFGSFINNIYSVFLTLLPDKFNQIVGEVSQVLSIIIDIALFLLAYFILPRTETNWRGIMPGAIGAGLLWGIAKKAFLFFVSTYISISNLVYGSVAAIIALLTWAYISGLIFLFGAYINVTYYRLSHEYIESNHQNQHQGFDFESSDNLPKT